MQVRVVDNRTSISGPQAPGASRVRQARVGQSGHPNFADILEREQRGVTFSKHAEERLQSSGQVMDPERLAQLQDAVDVASSKGARSTLVLMKGMALVVAPQTRTVVTVIPEDRMRQNVFTSIDSAVIVGK